MHNNTGQKVLFRRLFFRILPVREFRTFQGTFFLLSITVKPIFLQLHMIIYKCLYTGVALF